MNKMITSNIIAGHPSKKGAETLQAKNPATKQYLEGDFSVATEMELLNACEEAWKAWKLYKKTSGKDKATFLRCIADEIEGLGDQLVQRALEESGLPEGRIRGERGRTCGQLRLFAQLIEEGSWVDARIDEALPDRTPLPRVDIRNMRQALGPVAVFAASNFPLAFSTAGGDTASALASGCPVIVKAHSSHLGTNALISSAISSAVKKCGLPSGVFSSLQGSGRTIGVGLVKNPRIKAVGFTGSLQGGMALVNAAASRKEPIPVFAEMGSNNPIFILPNKIATSSEVVANQIAGSVNLGAGQFCTNPGLLVLLKDENTHSFLANLQTSFANLEASTMLNEGIFSSYESNKASCMKSEDVQTLFESSGTDDHWKAHPAIATVKGTSFLKNAHLQEEVFGPFTLVVICESKEEIKHVANALNGQLTASLLGNEDEFENWTPLSELLTEKVGRLIYNGVPTGVEVCHAMQHGGPFPASTDSRFTSVGTGSILRFSRPIAYQNCPDKLLPEELQRANPLGIWRLVNGKLTK